ncbi:kinase-like domain-containing protein, partial [Dimargaris cristalligena]
MPPLLPPPAVSSSNPSSVLSTSSSWSSSRPARPKTKVSTCQYKIGRVIGSGTFSVVKEAYHIQTGERFAAKVIPKQLLRGGKVQLLHNEVGILRHLSRGHPNLLQLHDCFETTHNVYLITELVTGGDLFDRLGRKGSFFESEAAVIIHAVVKALAYLHSQQVVHRDIKPENILFRNDRSDADLLIADFGLSVIMGDQNVQALKARCGTTGYMAPEILLHQPYGKPVDMWAVGVTTYLLLSGYLPFEPGYTPSGVPRPEVEDDSERDYAMIDDMFTYGDDLLFEPAGYWAGITPGAKHFIRGLIQTDPERRMTAEMALLHPWLATAATATTVSGQIEDP